MIPFAIGMILIPTSMLVWLFGIRPFVIKNKGIEYTGANIGISAWNDFTVAIEVRKETKKKCPFIEIFALMEIAAVILIITGVFSLA